MGIGDALVEARERAGLTVSEVSGRTRIRPAIIRDIEAGDFSACGGDFYARGHIRSIAKAVGADPEPLVREYDQAHRVPGPLSAVSLDELLSVSPAPPRPPRRLSRTAVTALTLAVIVVAVLVADLVAFHALSGSRPVAAAPAAQHQQAPRHTPSRRANPQPNASGVVPPASHAPSPTAAPSSPATPKHTTAPATAPAHSLAPVSAAAFGAGGGQGDNPAKARLAIDGSRGTAWRSDWYTSARFGNLYPGTGLLLNMGRPVTVTAARIVLGGAGGASFQVRAGTSRSLRGLAPAAQVSGAGGAVSVRFTHPAHGRFVLLWFTRLPQDANGTFQVSVHDVRVQGR